MNFFFEYSLTGEIEKHSKRTKAVLFVCFFSLRDKTIRTHHPGFLPASRAGNTIAETGLPILVELHVSYRTELQCHFGNLIKHL